MNYTAKEIADITHSRLIGDENVVVKNIAFDSRIIYSTVNTAFLAISTQKNSGEKFIQSAIEKGIKIIIAEKKTSEISGITWIIVENAITFIQDLAKYHLQQFPNVTTIGITGSNGKTIVKEWLYQSLWENFETVKSPKSFNSQLGLPLSLLQLNRNHELGIFEVGISKPEEMQKLEKIFQPKIGVLTYIGSAHIANFDNEIQLIDEKILLFKDSEVIIFNGDNRLVYNSIEEKYSSKKLISFGFETYNDLHIKNDWKDRNTDIMVSYFGEDFSFPAQRRDEATLHNALCVIAVLKHLQFSDSDIIRKINALRSVEMRLESISGIRNNIIINDSFNLDLDSLKIAYQFIKEYNKPSKSLVLTDFAEGKNQKQLYEEVVQLTNEQNFKTVFLIGEEIIKYAPLFNSQTFTFNNTNELIDSVQLNQLENELILLKGARKFEIEKVKNYLEQQKHDTVLEINLNALIHNINVHKSFLKPETKMMAMVKANSYGLGSFEIAEFLQHHHINYLGVAFADEGVELRKKGITVPIIVMNPEQHSYDAIIEYNLEPEIYSFRLLDLFYNRLKQKGFDGRYPIHLKLETGMHRLGFKEDEADEMIQKLNKLDVKVMSIFSHLSTSDVASEANYVLEQAEIFERFSSKLLAGLNDQPIRHLLNSAGITNFPQFQYNMVRIGIGMMGMSPNTEIKRQLQTVVSFRTVISQISEVKKGETVGYSRNFKADEDTRIATIPVGYADGIPRLISNGVGKLGVHNHLVPIAGNVCMDTLMLNIKDLPAKEGDEVIIFDKNPSLEDFAGYCKTISYEVLTSISPRVKRIYVKN